MNWPTVVAGVVATLLASLVNFAIVRAIPNYDDDEYIPPWAVTLVLGVAVSLLLGWVAR